MASEFWRVPLSPESIRFVDSAPSEEFRSFVLALRNSRIIALDAEWKPVSSGGQLRVSLLQVACRLEESDMVFIVDVISIPSSELLQPLKEALTSPGILKLGFKLRQDILNLAASFSAPEDFFVEIGPYIDIEKLHRQVRRKQRKDYLGQTASLAHICGEVLGSPLCKKLQCSNWEQRPLSEEQLAYAAADAHCLLAILDALQDDILEQLQLRADAYVGIAQILYPEKSLCSFVSRISLTRRSRHNGTSNLIYLRVYEETLSLAAPHADNRRKTRTRNVPETERWTDTEWCGPPPWDPAVGGDGCPKFLCDIMVEGLARQLRCVGIDAACPHGLKPEARQLIEQAQKEGRVLLTRDIKLLRQRLIPANQAYRVKHLTKKDQLTEIIETFQLSISEEQLLTRCTKCNGELFPEALTAQQAKAAAPNQEIPEEVMLQEGLPFWQCSVCRHLYWQGLQFRRAMEQFALMCN